MRFIIAITLSTLVISACGEQKDPLKAKKEELEKIKSEIAKLQSKAKALETEILAIEPAKESGKLVETQQVRVSEFRSYLTINGKADADQNTMATAQVPSTVTAVLVNPGDRVSAGQALAYLDATALKQNRLLAEQQVSFATTLYNKQKRLWEQGVGTEIQYISAKNQKEAAEKSLSTLDAQIAMYTVKSPISGTVESVDTKVGQTAAPGIPMFRVVNLNNMKVVADVAESYSGRINAGDIVMVHFPDVNKTVETKLRFASKIIDPLNRTFRIEIPISKVEGVKPNMIAHVKIVDYISKKAISVPTNCVQTAEENRYVVVAEIKDGKMFARRVTVKTGHTGDDRTEILDGLKEGDAVVINGYQELIDGQEISGEKAQANNAR